MNVLSAVILGVAMGAVFGIALEKSRVFEPGAIISQMQLRTFLMVKIFLTAVITGLIVLAVLNGVWGVKMYPKALVWQADIVGGLLLGAGISIAGACPGTVFAQIGAGYRDAWFTVAGGILGAMTFGYLEPTLRPFLLSGGPGKLTLDQLAHVPVLGAGNCHCGWRSSRFWSHWSGCSHGVRRSGPDVDGLAVRRHKRSVPVRHPSCPPPLRRSATTPNGRTAMTANVGTIDRVLRIVVGLALIATALGLFGPAYQTVWGWIGVIPLVTGLVSWCPAYTILGIRSCKPAAAG